MKGEIMIKLIFICFFILNISFSAEQYEFTKIYTFGDFIVETGFCNKHISIRISEKSKVLFFEDCSLDGVYCDIDTLFLNFDKLPDFIYCYNLEDYSIIGVLISDTIYPYYRKVDLIDVFSPEIYGNINLSNDETLKEFVLFDINNDNRKDIITNVIKRGTNLYPINPFSDTLSYYQIRNMVKNKLK